LIGFVFLAKDENFSEDVASLPLEQASGR
jgi:hypothetical protein